MVNHREPWSGVTNKDCRRVIKRLARTPGWRVDQKSNGHVRLIAPDGAVYYQGGSTSSPRTVVTLNLFVRKHSGSGKEVSDERFQPPDAGA